MTPEEKLDAVRKWENEYMISSKVEKKIDFKLIQKPFRWFYVKSIMSRIRSGEVIGELKWTKCYRSKDDAVDAFLEQWLYSLKKFYDDFHGLVDFKCNCPKSFSQVVMQLAILGKL